MKQQKVVQQTPVIAAAGKLRCLIMRMSAGNVPILLSRKDVPASQQVFYVKRGRELLGFWVDPSRTFLVAPVGIWLGMRHEPRPYLVYDIDKSEPFMYQREDGKPTGDAVHLRKPLDMKPDFVPSKELGQIKQYEMYGQVARAHMKPKSELNLLTIIMMIVAGIAGFFAGVAFGPNFAVHTATTTIPSNSTSTHTIIQTLFSIVRNLL